MQRYTPPIRRNDDPSCRCRHCRDRARGLSDKQAHDRHLTEAERLIDSKGYAVQGVLGSPSDCPFAYTVGLFLHDLPEFIMIGPPPETLQPLLENLAAAVLDHGFEVEAGDTIERLLRDMSAVAIGVDDPSEYLGTAFRLRSRRSHERRPVRALQIVLPDRDGHLPWHADYGWLRVPLLSDGGPTGRIIRVPSDD